MSSREQENRKRVYFLALTCMFVLSIIFLKSFYWPYEVISKRKLFVYAFALFMVVVIPIVCIKNKMLYEFLAKKLVKYTMLIKKNQQCKIHSLLVLLSVALCFLASFVVTHLVCLLIGTEYNQRMFAFVLALGALFVIMINVWKIASTSIEQVFFLVALIMGIFCIAVTPNRVGVSWDDEIHYARTLEISDLLNGIQYEADEKNIADYAENIYNHAGFDVESEQKYERELEELYENQVSDIHQCSDYGVWSIAYIPAAIGIVLGRGLGLSYSGVFNLGRISNLLMYVILITLAIKKVKYGKVLIATIGLIPTTIFMASCYSYDPWVVGFTILGFSYFYAEIQEDRPLETKNMIIMIGLLIVGCLPKAIYFPIFFPLLFLPKKKFKNSKQQKRYYACVIGACILLVATFMLPMLFNGAGTGDIRGGSDVNATEQIIFILQNPLAYAKILLKFLLNYIAFANSGSMLQKFAYVGDGYCYTIVGLILIVVAFLDRDQNEKKHFIVKGTGLIGCAAAIVLATTALYIDFTAVGAMTVAGMQARYMLPTVFPALYSIGAGGTTHKIDKNLFVCVPMLVIAVTFIFNMFILCVWHY